MTADNRQNILGYNSDNNQFDSSNVTANPDGSIIERQETYYQHIHKPSKCYPTLDDGVVVAGGALAWTLGDFVEIVPADTIDKMYDVHWVNFEAASANDVYEFVLYAGAIGSEVEAGRVRTYKAAVVSGAINVPMQVPLLPANTRLSAKVASSSGGDSVTVSLFYHEYN